MELLRCKVFFALLRTAITCVRGARKQKWGESHTDSLVEATGPFFLGMFIYLLYMYNKARSKLNLSNQSCLIRQALIPCILYSHIVLCFFSIYIGLRVLYNLVKINKTVNPLYLSITLIFLISQLSKTRQMTVRHISLTQTMSARPRYTLICRYRTLNGKREKRIFQSKRRMYEHWPIIESYLTWSRTCACEKTFSVCRFTSDTNLRYWATFASKEEITSTLLSGRALQYANGE